MKIRTVVFFLIMLVVCVVLEAKKSHISLSKSKAQGKSKAAVTLKTASSTNSVSLNEMKSEKSEGISFVKAKTNLRCPCQRH